MIQFIPGFCLRNKVAIENVANGIALGNVAKVDGFVKSPSAALRCILRHCGVQVSTPHSVGFARLASEAFYCAVCVLTFYDFIKVLFMKRRKIKNCVMH